MTQEAGGGSEFGQGRVAVGDPKKRVELAVLKAAVGQVREEYAFSQRRACRLLTAAVSSYRYQTKRSDEGLRLRLVKLAPGEAAVRLSALAYIAATQRRRGLSSLNLRTGRRSCALP